MTDRISEVGVSRGEALARHLERRICDLRLAPGARIGTRSDLRRSYSVGVATVNEALRLMSSRGIIETRPGPGGGVFVTNGDDRARVGRAILGLEVTQATLSECVECRAIIEPVIYRHAARVLGPQDVEALELFVQQMTSALDDQDDFLRANWGFHRRVAALCDNRPLQTMYLALIDVLETGLEAFEFGRHGLDDAAVHGQLIAAMVKGEGRWLERAIRRHAELSPLPS